MAGEDRRFMGVGEFLGARENETEFDVARDDFGGLVIRSGSNDDKFHYFFDTRRNRLIKTFLLRGSKRVDTVCDVILIREDDGGYSPRLTVWKRDKTKGAKAVAEDEAARPVKAMVRLGDCHETFWRLIDCLRSFKDIDLPPDAFRVADASQVQLLDALQDHDKGEVLAAVATYLQGQVTEREVRMLVNRRAALETFQRMLNDSDFTKEEMERRSKNGVEALWQQFFEENQWIFGYGLQLVPCEGYRHEKLEQVTTGHSAFESGKRVDAAMRTRGAIQSLMFAEIKRPDTDLLKKEPYRKPDVYAPAAELVGAVAQVQKTAHKAVRRMEETFRQRTGGGDLLFEVSTVRPRQAVVIGDLAQFKEGGDINPEKLTNFELFRGNHHGVEIITFDELYERARFIVDVEDEAL